MFFLGDGSNFFTAFGNWLYSVLAALFSGLLSALQYVGDFIVAGFNKVVAFMSSLGGWLGGVVEGLWSHLSSMATAYWAQLATWPHTLFEKLQTVLIELFTGVLTWLDGVVPEWSAPPLNAALINSVISAWRSFAFFFNASYCLTMLAATILLCMGINIGKVVWRSIPGLG